MNVQLSLELHNAAYNYESKTLSMQLIMEHD